jgi:MoaA/NifB/PqqE/SkfB family radical SAM enzyme
MEARHPSPVLFLQPRHNCAPDSGDGHIHLSAPLITIMSQVYAATKGALAMDYRDENFACERGEIEADIIAVNLVGAPYIPEAIQVIKRARNGSTVILGGQIVDSVKDDFAQLFCSVRTDLRVVNGNDLKVLAKVLQIDEIPEKETVSSIPIWETIPEEEMRKYLSHSMSFYLAQGCKYSCTFCQAEKGTPEKYRDVEMAAMDLEWLSKKAMSFGYSDLDIYFSNLDIFQTGEVLEVFLDKVLEVKALYPTFTYSLRGLATVESMLHMSDRVLKKAKEAGFVSVGLGVDGATPAVWRKTAKTHNFSSKDKNAAQRSIDAIKRCHGARITPEVLMVFGHDTGDFEESKEDLEVSFQFSKDMVDQFGAIPRPHVVKTLVPGAVEWKKKKRNRKMIELLLQNPEYFQALDYTALPSEISHPNRALRSLVEKYYRRVCELDPEYSTKIIYPNTPETQQWAKDNNTSIPALNEGKYDR